MRTFLQYLALAVALMLMFFGGNRLRRENIPRETTEAETLETVQTVETQPPETTQPETTARIELKDVAPVAAMEAGHIFAYDTAAQEMVYCSADPTEQLFPASITKLFSAWVALRILSPDTVVTAGWELGLMQPGSSTARIALDSRLTVEMLIEGMLLPSGNDAALVLAAAAGRQILGNAKATAQEAVAEFVEEMNRAAAALNFENSHFENPDGYHGEKHYSCPEDLAKIAALALDEPVMRRCMGLQKDTVTFVSGEKLLWENTNRLLNPKSSYYSPEAIGMKTGYTHSAGYCLLAAFGAEEPFVVGVFGGGDAESRYADAAALYDAWLTLGE